MNPAFPKEKAGDASSALKKQGTEVNELQGRRERSRSDSIIGTRVEVEVCSCRELLPSEPFCRT